MLKQINKGMAVAAVLVLSGCATGSWMGAEAETAYDKELAVKRLAELQNNDDYYEIHKDGRIYALSDEKAFATWLKTGEIPLVVTKIAAGPKGETLKLALTKNDSKAMESKPGYQGSAQKMFEGNLEGLAKGFFGVVQPEDGTWYVFSDWATLKSFRQSGKATGFADKGPDGNKVVYVNASAKPAEAATRFGKLFN